MKNDPTYFDAFSNRINISTVNIIFTIGTIAVLVSHTLFAVGLYDGTYSLFQITKDPHFYSIDPSRKVANILKLLPTYLFLKFPVSSSLNLLVAVFSFGLIWVHILSFIGCYLILPKKKKHMMFFPLFAFFAGPAISLHISISAALSICSYVWFIAYIIYYSDLSRKIHRILFFILPLPLILSHELMSYMAWPLIYLCWQKIKTEKNLFNNKTLIGLTMIYLFITSVVQTFMTVFHETLTNTINDMNTVIGNIRTHLNFLFYPNFNFLLAFSLLIMILFLIQPYKDAIKYKIKKILVILYSLAFISVAIASVIQTIIGFIHDYSVRFYPPIIILPLSLLIWWIYEKRKTDIEKSSKLFLLSCMLFCLTFVFCRITFDYKFYKHQTAIAAYLSKCKGVLEWEHFRNHFRDVKFSNELLPFQGWQIFEISLLYPRSKVIKAALLSPIATCIGGCELVLNTKQSQQCKEDCNKLYAKKHNSILKHRFTQLHKNRFFDTSEVTYYIINNISECEK